MNDDYTTNRYGGIIRTRGVPERWGSRSLKGKKYRKARAARQKHAAAAKRRKAAKYYRTPLPKIPRCRLAQLWYIKTVGASVLPAPQAVECPACGQATFPALDPEDRFVVLDSFAAPWDQHACLSNIEVTHMYKAWIAANMSSLREARKRLIGAMRPRTDEGRSHR